MSKKGAMELSISTIVIIVIALTMLILGIVLVRSIMCGAIDLTSDVSSKAKDQVNKLFEATGGEIQCVGSEGTVTMNPGRINTIYCRVVADSRTEYKIEITGIETTDKTKLTDNEIQRWIVTDSWSGEVSPSDQDPKKVARLDIPKDAPQVGIIARVKATKPDSSDFVIEQDLDFKISRQGLVKATMC